MLKSTHCYVVKIVLSQKIIYAIYNLQETKQDQEICKQKFSVKYQHKYFWIFLNIKS